MSAEDVTEKNRIIDTCNSIIDESVRFSGPVRPEAVKTINRLL